MLHLFCSFLSFIDILHNLFGALPQHNTVVQQKEIEQLSVLDMVPQDKFESEIHAFPCFNLLILIPILSKKYLV